MGVIRKNARFPGQEELNEGPYPEKDTISRTRRDPRGVSSGKTHDFPDGRSLTRGVIRKKARFPGQESIPDGSHPEKRTISRTGED